MICHLDISVNCHNRQSGLEFLSGHETDAQVSEALVHTELMDYGLIDYGRRELPVSRTPEQTELEALSCMDAPGVARGKLI